MPIGSFIESQWDVIAAGYVLVQQTSPLYDWSASLWYARLTEDEQYRWHEISYFGPPNEKFRPYDLSNQLRDADLANGGHHLFRVAWGPSPIDDEDLSLFCDRWITILTTAARAELKMPGSMPLAARFWEQL